MVMSETVLVWKFVTRSVMDGQFLSLFEKLWIRVSAPIGKW
jgi:hypothetical protein